MRLLHAWKDVSIVLQYCTVDELCFFSSLHKVVLIAIWKISLVICVAVTPPSEHGCESESRAYMWIHNHGEIHIFINSMWSTLHRCT